MKKIDKDTKTAKSYHDWVDQLEAANKPHGNYSSSHRFHKDVLMNLIACQGGICAYSEMIIADLNSYDDSNWNESGRYTGNHETFADLEHFDPELKEKQAWLWSNLFAAHSVLNQRVKRRKKIHYILKPDHVDYDSFRLLAYNYKEHKFYPNPRRSVSEKKKIQEMIIILGINYGPVISNIKKTFEFLLDDIRFEEMTWDEFSNRLREFPTAFQMIRNQFENQI